VRKSVFSYEEALEEVRSRIGYRCRASAVAHKCGVSKSMLSEVLSGRKIASIQTMEKLGYRVAFTKVKP
jgi:transcriptional regulator with XRE-family HTH domain